MPMLRQAVAYWADANQRLGGAADHTEIFRYVEMLADEDP
jgi:3-hydroxyisobutyrate dehydrogenase